MKRIKSLFDNNNYRKYIELMRASQLPYEIRSSNYTLEIISDYFNIYFTHSMKSDRAFIAFAKIKKDIEDKKLTAPDVSESDLDYFNFADIKRLQDSKETIYNIDIKSAYASVLLNAGVITKKTYGYMATLAKEDRLACVGMLASRKNVFSFDEENKPSSYYKIINPLSGFFFMCVLEVQKIMNDIRQMLGNDFLFYWVDGIYFENEGNRLKIEHYLKEKGYKNSFDKLTDFVFVQKENVDFLFFKKYDEKNNEWIEKWFNLPKKDSKITREILNYLGLYKNQNFINAENALKNNSK